MTGGSVPEQTWLTAMTPLHAGEPNTPFPVSDPQYLAGRSGSQLPNVEGSSLVDAKATLAAQGFTQVNVTYSSDTSAAANTVISQDPKQSALPGATINLVVSAGSGTSVNNTNPGTGGGSGGAGGGDNGGGWSGGDGSPQGDAGAGGSGG
jgi:hypothetical protein